MQRQGAEQVVLVDPADQEIGTLEKLEAHQKGLLHRAFSVFLFRSDGRVLLQQRAEGKYHSGGLWSNACCGHPRPGEPVTTAAIRRTHEELGVACALQAQGSFLYRAVVGAGLVEHELDHVFVGQLDVEPMPDPGEIMDHRWVLPAELEQLLQAHPEQFTAWFPLCWGHVRAFVEGRRDQAR